MLSLCLWAGTLYSNCEDPKNYTHETFEFLESIYRTNLDQVWEHNKLARRKDRLKIAQRVIVNTRKLVVKGYLPRSQLLADELRIDKIQLEIEDSKAKIESRDLQKEIAEINFQDSCKNSYKTPPEALIKIANNNRQRWEANIQTFPRRIRIAKKEEAAYLEVVNYYIKLRQKGYTTSLQLQQHRDALEAAKRSLAGLYEVEEFIESYIERYKELAEELKTDS